MHVRCERCSTVYELDERILPPGGAPVQCTRCQQVFHAHPPQDPGKTSPMFPAVPGTSGAGAPAEPPGPGVSGRAGSDAAGPVPPASLAGRPAPAPAAPRPSAPQPPSTAAIQEGPAATGGDWRTDTVAILVRQIRSRRMWTWLAPLFLLVAAGATGGVLWYGSRQVSPEAVARRQEGLRLVAGDDTRSLQRAAEVLAEAVRLDPKLFQARADRALALTLLAADERDRASVLEAGFRALDAERFRLEAEEEEGWQRRQAEVIGRMKTLKGRIEPLRDRATALGGEAFGDLEVVARRHGDDPAVARSLALHYVLDGNVEQGSRVIRNARAARLADAWLDLAEAAADVVVANSEVVRERAVARLAPLAAAHPDLLRARMLLARAQADLGRTDAAVGALDGVLEVNGAHERAREMKAWLLEPPSVEPLRPTVPQRAPPPGQPGRLPRKPEGAQR